MTQDLRNGKLSRCWRHVKSLGKLSPFCINPDSARGVNNPTGRLGVSAGGRNGPTGDHAARFTARFEFRLEREPIWGA